MSEDPEPVDIPDSKGARLRFAIGNLFEDFGSTSSWKLGLVVNLGLAAIGLLVYWQTSGIVAFAGGVWMLLNLFGVVQWVIGE